MEKPPEHPAAFFCPDLNCGEEWDILGEMMLGRMVKAALVLALGAGVAVAQGNSAASFETNPVQQELRPWNFGVLMQGGVGLTEGRDTFRFVMAGVHAGKVLTPMVGHGLLRGNFEYGVELFPFWQSYTPTMQRQNCVSVPFPGAAGGTGASCSAAFTVGGTYTGASVTPIILRWNFAGTRRIAPWVQGAGGLIWTNHKYPAFGGPPVSTGGVTNSSLGDNGANDDTSVFNFTPQFGVGMHYFVNAHRSIDFGANAIHISSASLGDKNPGVNASVQFTLGYSWWK
jgi:lipid A 3-O-deacylase